MEKVKIKLLKTFSLNRHIYQRKDSNYKILLTTKQSNHRGSHIIKNCNQINWASRINKVKGLIILHQVNK
jgi:hypothetical protein